MKRPEPPEHLDDEARRKWAEAPAILDGRGEALDAGTLDPIARHASAWSQWVQAAAQVKTLGMVVKSPAGFAQENPFFVRGPQDQSLKKDAGATC